MLDFYLVSKLLSIHPRIPSAIGKEKHFPPRLCFGGEIAEYPAHHLHLIEYRFGYLLLSLFRDRKLENSIMEYLAQEHQDLAIQGLAELRSKLPSVQDVFENLKAEELSFPRSFKLAQENMSKNLPTASVIWEYMLDKTENKLQKFAILNKLFQVQIATGPWKAALETAQRLFNETMAEYSSENAIRRAANDGDFGTCMLS